MRMQAPILELAGVAHSYGDVTPLADVTLTLGPGELLVITGGSGSGKSTLLGIMGLMEKPDSGRYLLRGKPVGELSDGALARLRNRHFGFVFQQYALIPGLNVWQNVARPLGYAGLNRREQKRRAVELLSELGLAHLAGRRPAQLSGGEQKRVAIARALVNDPAIVLADEPTANLPAGQWQPILDAFEALRASGKAVVLASHDQAVAARASRVLVLAHGRLHGVGGPGADVFEPEPAASGTHALRQPPAPLQLNLLGEPHLIRAGAGTALTPRQSELLALLAANPGGLSGEQLLLLVYGDEGRLGTLKANLSRLRSLVRIASKPYRIDEPFEADFVTVLRFLKHGATGAAVAACSGALLPSSSAPGVTELREQLEAAVRLAVIRTGEPDLLFRVAELARDDLELWDLAAAALDPDDPRQPLAAAAAARVRRDWDLGPDKKLT